MRRKKVFITIFSIATVISLLMLLDIDTDRLLTYRELFQTKTNPLQRDTDSDRLSDGEEIERRTNPLLPDTDDDGILDGDEVYTYGTNPLLRDSDYDKVEDFQEINFGTNPINPDSDGDGLFDCESFPLDSNRPLLTMTISEVNLVKKGWNPFLMVSYDIPIDASWVYNSALVYNRLDWSDFHILINGNEIPFDRGYLSVFCRVNLETEMNVTVQYRSDVVFKQLVATPTSYTMEEITTYWNNNKMPVESLQGDPYTSMHNAFDEYAKVISGFIFMRVHISELKRRFTSIENWYEWLYYSFHGARSLEEVLDNLGKYVETSGLRDLVEKVWIELHALATTAYEFKNIIERYPDAVGIALAKLALRELRSPESLLGLVGTLESPSIGDDLDKAIYGVTRGLEWTYVQLASEFFGWVSDVSPLEPIESYARGAQWYMDHLSEIRGLKNYYGVSFPQVIEPKLQYKPVGETGVAWWPTCYSFWPAKNDPFRKPEATVFPMTEVRWIYNVDTLYGPKAGEEKSFDVFLATESIVLNHLKENGFRVHYMPPTEEEKTQFQQIRATSKYFTEKLDKMDRLFLDSETLAKEIVTLSSAFTNFELISDALGALRRYVFATRFLIELNDNTWIIT